MEPVAAPSAVRIGELSRRVGVSDHLLRAWESRYGLLAPTRSSGGFRLYSERDEGRVRRMQFHLARGLSAAEAARAAVADDGAPPREAVAPGAGSGDSAVSVDLAGALRRTLDDCDEPAAQQVLDRLLSDFTLATVLRDVVLPYLHELGDRWEREEVTVAQEHFASNVIRGRLTGLARGWGGGRGPRAVLACPPGELHDLPLLIFGVILSRGGWRVVYFGANTPVEELVIVVNESRPELVVLAAATTDRFAPIVPELSRLAELAPLALAGAGATGEIAEAVSARLLNDDPVTAAEKEAFDTAWR